MFAKPVHSPMPLWEWVRWTRSWRPTASHVAECLSRSIPMENPMEVLSLQLPSPSKEILLFASLYTAVKLRFVNSPLRTRAHGRTGGAQRSLLKSSGQTHRVNTLSTATTQNRAWSGFDSRVGIAWRLDKSVIATKLRKPRRAGTYVMSTHRT